MPWVRTRDERSDGETHFDGVGGELTDVVNCKGYIGIVKDALITFLAKTNEG